MWRKVKTFLNLTCTLSNYSDQRSPCINPAWMAVVHIPQMSFKRSTSTSTVR